MSQYPPPPPGYPQQPPPQGYPPQYGQQYPPQYGQPLPYAPIKPPSPRPGSVTAIAIIAIVFGTLGVLAMLCSLPQQFGLMNFGRPNPMQDAMRSDHLLFSWTIGSLLVGVVLAAVQLFGGIASLSLKSSGRSALIFYAWARIITGVIEMVVGLAVMQPRTMAIVQKTMASNPAMANLQVAMKFAQWGGAVFGVLLLAWPIAVLVVMGQQRVKEAFARGWVEVPPMPPAPPMSPPPYA